MGVDMPLQELGEIFHVLEGDVVKAWQFWENQGLVRLTHVNDDISVEFLSAIDEDVPVKKPDKPDKVDFASQSDFFEKPKEVHISVRPTYEMDELLKYQRDSPIIAKLFKHGEQVWGFITYSHMNLLFSFYDWLRLPVDVIMFLMSYCAENGTTDLRYLEKTAIDWADRGLKTLDSAKNHLRSNDSVMQIMRCFSQNPTIPSKKQLEHIDKWLNEFGMPVELVLDACDRSAMKSGTARMDYVDGILYKWHEKGIYTMEEVDAADAEWKAKQESEAKTEAHPVRRNRFSNFTPRERDYDELERIEHERIRKSVGL